MLRKHGNAKIGNAFEIKREDIRPVALEVAFEDLKVSGKLTVEKSIDEVNPFTFVGTGLVVKGTSQVLFRQTIRPKWRCI